MRLGGTGSREHRLSLFAYEVSSDQCHIPHPPTPPHTPHATPSIPTHLTHPPHPTHMKPHPNTPTPPHTLHSIHELSAHSHAPTLHQPDKASRLPWSCLVPFVSFHAWMAAAWQARDILLGCPFFASFQPLVASLHVHGGLSSLGGSVGRRQLSDAERVHSIPCRGERNAEGQTWIELSANLGGPIVEHNTRRPSRTARHGDSDDASEDPSVAVPARRLSSLRGARGVHVSLVQSVLGGTIQ